MLSSIASTMTWRRPLSNNSLFIWYSLMTGIIRWPPRADRALPLHRDDRNQDVRGLLGAGVQRHRLAEDFRRTVAGVVVLERPHAGEDGAERAQAHAGPAGEFVVSPPHGEAEAVAGRHHDRRRPDLDVELVDLARCERLHLVVGVIGPVGQRELGVELPVGGA